MFLTNNMSILGETGYRIYENYVLSWQKYTEELHKKDLDELDNDFGVVTHL